MTSITSKAKFRQRVIRYCPCQVFVGKIFLNANSELMVKFENFL